jgi:hypothetical protein
VGVALTHLLVDRSTAKSADVQHWKSARWRAGICLLWRVEMGSIIRRGKHRKFQPGGSLMFRTRFLVILLTAVMAAGVGGSVFAQEKPKDNPKLTETGPWVVSKGKIGDILSKDDKVIASFPTTEKAQAFAKEMNEKLPTDSPFIYSSYRKEPKQDAPKATGPDLIENTGPKGGIITEPDLKSVKEAKEAVDRAKKIANGDGSLLQAEERKLGSTLKEYKDRLKQSFEEALEAKKTLTSGVVQLAMLNSRRPISLWTVTTRS